MEALAQTETEFLERMKKRLSLKRINAWLDEQGGDKRLLLPAELVKDNDSYIRFVYSLLYGDSRETFAYQIEEPEADTAAGAPVHTAGYVVPAVTLRRKT
jgi:hypothetical protein